MKRLLVCLALVLLAYGGSLLWSQEWQLVGTLATDVSSGETLVNVRWQEPGTEGYLVLIESRDGEVTERGEIQSIHGNFIVLRERLRNEFLAGGRIYQ